VGDGPLSGMETILGRQQECPACGSYQPSGLTLPEECITCHGTGEVDLGIDREELKKLLLPDSSDVNK
jgi:hypothetical protein